MERGRTITRKTKSKKKLSRSRSTEQPIQRRASPSSSPERPERDPPERIRLPSAPSGIDLSPGLEPITLGGLEPFLTTHKNVWEHEVRKYLHPKDIEALIRVSKKGKVLAGPLNERIDKILEGLNQQQVNSTITNQLIKLALDDTRESKIKFNEILSYVMDQYNYDPFILIYEMMEFGITRYIPYVVKKYDLIDKVNQSEFLNDEEFPGFYSLPLHLYSQTYNPAYLKIINELLDLHFNPYFMGEPEYLEARYATTNDENIITLLDTFRVIGDPDTTRFLLD